MTGPFWGQILGAVLFVVAVAAAIVVIFQFDSGTCRYQRPTVQFSDGIDVGLPMPRGGVSKCASE
jgi:hypothetical protein